MKFSEYQELARRTAIYPNLGHNVDYPTLGLCNEAGEVAGQIKKLHRDDGGKLTPERLVKLKKELGDVLWYMAALCSELDLSLEAVAVANIEKLRSRQDRGKLGGDGDNR